MDLVPVDPGARSVKTWLRLTALAFVVALTTAAGVWGLTRSGASATERLLPESATKTNDEHAFAPGGAARAGVTFASVEMAEMAPVVNVTGAVAFHPDRVTAVGARIAGRVRSVEKHEGQAVARGEILATLESAELGEAQAALASVKARLEAARAEERRQVDMGEATSRRDTERATESALVAAAEMSAAEQRVRALAGPGGASDGALGILQMRSPIAGKVIERSVSLGQSVDPTFTAFRVADLHAVWVELRVSERELVGVHVGDGASIIVHGDPEPLSARVAQVGDVIDPETRSAAVRVEVDNEALRLRPGQAVTAHIRTTARRMGPVVPREAIVLVDGEETVFLERASGLVEARRVTLGPADEQRVSITDGLAAGDRVATTGAFALKAEMFR